MTHLLSAVFCFSLMLLVASAAFSANIYNSSLDSSPAPLSDMIKGRAFEYEEMKHDNGLMKEARRGDGGDPLLMLSIINTIDTQALGIKNKVSGETALAIYLRTKRTKWHDELIILWIKKSDPTDLKTLLQGELVSKNKIPEHIVHLILNSVDHFVLMDTLTTLTVEHSNFLLLAQDNWGYSGLEILLKRLGDELDSTTLRILKDHFPSFCADKLSHLNLDQLQAIVQTISQKTPTKLLAGNDPSIVTLIEERLKGEKELVPRRTMDTLTEVLGLISLLDASPQTRAWEKLQKLPINTYLTKITASNSTSPNHVFLSLGPQCSAKAISNRINFWKIPGLASDPWAGGKQVKITFLPMFGAEEARRLSERLNELQSALTPKPTKSAAVALDKKESEAAITSGGVFFLPKATRSEDKQSYVPAKEVVPSKHAPIASKQRKMPGNRQRCEKDKPKTTSQNRSAHILPCQVSLDKHKHLAPPAPPAKNSEIDYPLSNAKLPEGYIPHIDYNQGIKDKKPFTNEKEIYHATRGQWIDLLLHAYEQLKALGFSEYQIPSLSDEKRQLYFFSSYGPILVICDALHKYISEVIEDKNDILNVAFSEVQLKFFKDLRDNDLKIICFYHQNPIATLSFLNFVEKLYKQLKIFMPVIKKHHEDSNATQTFAGTWELIALEANKFSSRIGANDWDINPRLSLENLIDQYYLLKDKNGLEARGIIAMMGAICDGYVYHALVDSPLRRAREFRNELAHPKESGDALEAVLAPHFIFFQEPRNIKKLMKEKLQLIDYSNEND